MSSPEPCKAMDRSRRTVSKVAMKCGDLMATNLHEPSLSHPEAGFWGLAGRYLVIKVGGTIPIPL